MSTWLRSRRFYAGVLAGLVPLLLLAAQANGDRPSNEREQRVIVRNYGGCCPDSTDTARLRDLIESMPPDVVLIENFSGCCCGEGSRTTRGQGASRVGAAVPPRSWNRGNGPQAAAPDLQEAPPEQGVLSDRMFAPDEPIAAGLPAFGDVPLPPATTASRFPGWLGVLAAPLLFLVGGTSGRPDPPGTICPGDSGLPVGPNRDRC